MFCVIAKCLYIERH